MPGLSVGANAKELVEVYHALVRERASADSWADKLRPYVDPADDDLNEEGISRNPEGTAGEAAKKLAGGHLSYITPSQEIWFKWAAPDGAGIAGRDAAESWYNQASDVALREFTASNFYSEMQAVFAQRVNYGTGCLYCGESKYGGLFFRSVPFGDFVCAEDEYGVVDTVMREFRLTPYQAVAMFGEAGVSEVVRADYRDDRKCRTKEYVFLHVCRPRKVVDKRVKDGAGKQVESVYVELGERRVVSVGGYDEFPYFVTRFLRPTKGVYGPPPGKLCWKAIRQCQFIDRSIDTLLDVTVYPRILALADQVGEIDLRGGGMTVVSPDHMRSGTIPREWATAGRIDWAQNRLEEKRQMVKDAFYVTMIEMFSSIQDRDMTATEVVARENEKVLTFSPSFTLFTSEFEGMMRRVFSMLCRMGRFGEFPEAVLAGEGAPLIPKSIYQSKIAVTLRRVQNEKLSLGLNRMLMLAQAKPEVMDNVDTDRVVRLGWRNDGAPEECLVAEEEMKSRREQTAKANEAMMAAEAGANVAKAEESMAKADALRKG